MIMSKRYYWLKLKEDFFRDKVMKKMRKIAGGDTYVVIWTIVNKVDRRREKNQKSS
ncbi:phage replisome organizer N-terminal domain-containing protein, partial [uncultured Ruminococcus sp.]|uniref:phage replisome organizer N-terminal domain-containing protein n=1 Tax=uncultured Ruminococcus sp. TaxID=165186 RepID=UPI00266EABBF